MSRVLVTGGSGFIGTNFIEEWLKKPGVQVTNLDLQPPPMGEHRSHWLSCDVLSMDQVREAFHVFEPTNVVHLAGRTDMAGKTVDDYRANHDGTRNVIAAINDTPSVQHAIFTSSQFVVGPGPLPAHDTDYRPHTVYGMSKVKSEETVRRGNVRCPWTIVRPTNIWGRWHPRYPNEAWRVIKQGRYCHPGSKRVQRSYGYVGNVVGQLIGIIESPIGKTNEKVFYLGDPPIDVFEWVNAFSLELCGRPVKVVPRSLVRILAFVGDCANTVGGTFPIYSSRYQSMTEEYLTPMESTFELLGRSPHNLLDGVKATVAWLRTRGPFWRY